MNASDSRVVYDPRKWILLIWTCVCWMLLVNRVMCCVNLQVTVNGVDYQPQTASPNKKHAKAMAATVALQALGEVTHSSDSHVTFNISHPASV